MTTIPMPVQIDDVSLAFPADALDYMPAWEDIPDDFKDGTYGAGGEWVQFQRTMFFEGLSERFAFIPADGVDPEMAWRQLRAITGSFAPKHEHKEAAVAYLASLWMKSLVYARPDTPDEEHIALGEASLEEWLEYWKENG